jgi:hypothetical protein
MKSRLVSKRHSKTTCRFTQNTKRISIQQNNTHLSIVDNHIIVGKLALFKDETILLAVANDQCILPGLPGKCILVKETVLKSDS